MDRSSWIEPVQSYDYSVLLKDTTQGRQTPVRLEPSVLSQALYHLATALPIKKEPIINL